jgi:hypothetical protein
VNGDIERLTPGQAAAEADEPVQLPAQWAWATIEQLAALEANAITDGPFGSNLKTSHYTSSGPRVIRLQNIGDGAFVDAPAHISQEHYESLQRHRVEAGDIVIAALGERPPRACVIPTSVGPAIVKADCIRFKPNSRLAVGKFLSWMLNAESTRERAALTVHGVGRPRLNLQDVKAISLPLPPLAEQHRIVAEVEKQLTRLDAAVEALHRVRGRLKGYRTAILRAACEGRLVPTEGELARREGREFEPTERLLDRLLRGCQGKGEGRQVAKGRAAGLRDGGERTPDHLGPSAPVTGGPRELPDGWTWATADQVVARSEYGTSVKCDYDAGGPRSCGFRTSRLARLTSAT